jgi:solute carrier family 25 folate transporter 32
VTGRERQYTGIIHAFRSIIREEGVGALYRGISPALFLVSNGAFEFAAYEELKRLTIKHGTRYGSEKELASHHFLAMGATAKVVASSITFPLSVIRARLYQRNPDYLINTPNISTSTLPTSTTSTTSTTPKVTTNSNGRIDMKYRDMRHVITSILGNEGIRGFYRGLVPQLMKTAPASAITFLCYESTLRFIAAS